MELKYADVRMKQPSLFIRCGIGLERFLQRELNLFGFNSSRFSRQSCGITLENPSQTDICNIYYNTRVANRLFFSFPLGQIENKEEFIEKCKEIPWENYLNPKELSIDVTPQLPHIEKRSPYCRSSGYVGKLVGDAINDRIRSSNSPNRVRFSFQSSALKIVVRVEDTTQVEIRIDISGSSLEQREYLPNPVAPYSLEPGVCAALLLDAILGEKERAISPSPLLTPLLSSPLPYRELLMSRVINQNAAIVDPFCGDGTILMEGVNMVLGSARRSPPSLLSSPLAKSTDFTEWSSAHHSIQSETHANLINIKRKLAVCSPLLSSSLLSSPFSPLSSLFPLLSSPSNERLLLQNKYKGYDNAYEVYNRARGHVERNAYNSFINVLHHDIKSGFFAIQKFKKLFICSHLPYGASESVRNKQRERVDLRGSWNVTEGASSTHLPIARVLFEETERLREQCEVGLSIVVEPSVQNNLPDGSFSRAQKILRRNLPAFVLSSPFKPKNIEV